MTSTTSPRLSRTDEGPSGSRHTGDHQIAAQRQSGSMRTSDALDRRTDEARRRSEAVQAAIDIAAGW
jgi:hypothetical protein